MPYQLAQSTALLRYISSQTGSFLCVPLHPSVVITLIAIATCRARAFTFCIRSKQLPPEVKLVFGGFQPSIGHGTRVCKILRAEWLRQARMYRDALFLPLLHDQHVMHKKTRWREYTGRIDHVVDYLWQGELRRLRSQFSTTRRGSTGVVHTYGDIALPDFVMKTLGLGPKFAVEKRRTPTELLATVRQVANCAPPEDTDRCVSEGLDVLLRGKPANSGVPVGKVAAYLIDNALCVVPSDKEGGFAVLPRGLYFEKAHQAISSVFRVCEGINLAKIRSRAKNLCSELDLPVLAREIGKSDKLSLNMFFTTKTHKEGAPFRTIVSERNSWQYELGRFLQDKLKLFPVEDPFRIFNSGEVVNFLKQHPGARFRAFSIDIKDLYYSLPHEGLLACIDECIDSFGAVPFQNTTGISSKGFLELLSLYITSTFVEWNGKTYIQKEGVSIGSSIAPFLSDLLLAKFDRALNVKLGELSVVKTFRYVDDYLLILRCDLETFHSKVMQVLQIFRECLYPLVVTHEMPERDSIRFLDLKISFSENHTCWCYEPRSQKPVLPFSSAHSKLVKRGIVQSCFHNALERSCHHVLEASLLAQSERLEREGYPRTLLISVAEAMHRKRKRLGTDCNSDGTTAEKREKVAVIPYMHSVSHRLKKIGQRLNVKVVFSAPDKLSQLTNRTCPVKSMRKRCMVRHRTQFVDCALGVVYRTPFSCGACYVGQTGRCLNDRLREHANNVRGGKDGFLAQHVSTCGCTPLFEKTTVLCKIKEENVRIIYEAAQMELESSACVSKPSVALSDKEICFLRCEGRRSRHGVS